MAAKHSHDYKTGLLAKKKFKKQDLYKMLIGASPQQRSLISEIIHQSGGGAPSQHYGKKPLPKELYVRIDPETHKYLKSIDHLPNHAHAKKVFENKKAAGTISEIGEVIVNGGKAAYQYGKTAVKDAMEWAGEHSHEIGTALQTVGTVTQTVADVGGAIGLWGQDVSQGMQDFSKTLGDIQKSKFKTNEQKKAHAEKKAKEKAKKAAAAKKKKGGGQIYSYQKYL